MRGLFITARAITKQDRIIRVVVKEGSNVLKYDNRVQLIRLSEQIKNMSCS